MASTTDHLVWTVCSFFFSRMGTEKWIEGIQESDSFLRDELNHAGCSQERCGGGETWWGREVIGLKRHLWLRVLPAPQGAGFGFKQPHPAFHTTCTSKGSHASGLHVTMHRHAHNYLKLHLRRQDAGVMALSSQTQLLFVLLYHPEKRRISHIDYSAKVKVQSPLQERICLASSPA